MEESAMAAAVADVALAEPMNCLIEIAGPDQIRQDELVRQFLRARADPRREGGQNTSSEGIII
jgi:hypothetical protein